MLFYSGATRAIGNVDDGTTHTDFLEEERQRGITIKAAATSFPWQGHIMSLIDTPGHVDFSMEVVRSVRVLDGAVAVLDGVKGVEAQTVATWKHLQRHGVPVIAFVNKMDREGASISRSRTMVNEELQAKTLALQVPLVSGKDFNEIMDLVEMEVISWDASGSEVAHKPLTKESVGEALFTSALVARQELLEDLYMVDDSFAEVSLALWAIILCRGK